MPAPVSFKRTQSQIQAHHPGKLSRKSSTGTFTPKFINSLIEKDTPATDSARDLSEFSGKRWVWVKDDQLAFIKGWVTEDNGSTMQVRCDNESVDRTVDSHDVDRVNPPKFNLAEDMADLTYLNEASIIHNLRQRYEAGLIYTYSGLFLVTVNPYRNLPIYDSHYIDMYKEKRRGDTSPHIFATSDIAFHDMLEMHENQAILITGESGAGKTENTKKVIQYFAAIASGPREVDNLEQQILHANPILEAFGNAQTVRNNNSSRFGKFIRIEFDHGGNIAGANIEWYLLEKSRVVFQRPEERNYHVFYQLVRGADKSLRENFLLGEDLGAYRYIQNSRKTVQGINDANDFSVLKSAFKTMGIKISEQMNLWKTLAAILHLGNIVVANDRSDQARIPDLAQAELTSHILGIPSDSFVKALLNPQVRAGREWVTQSRTKSQVLHTLDALAKALYEKLFGYLVERINQSMERPLVKTSFIGVLDIAGFEIFETNSFEQLCINYTNEKLQQFFNHHMFVLEQEEYAREDIEWKFIDFGHDLQPTIDLIEKSNPIGLLSLLDEECIMPKGSDVTFTSKVYELWDGKSKQFKPSRLRNEKFILTHYAADVEYSTEEWLSKNKDPLNDNITNLLADSTDPHIASLFEGVDGNRSKRVKKGIFRTVAQRHKEQLGSLMTQLNSTQPHFVRCIIPNEYKHPQAFNGPLVLDQLRCNGVLEGIRIARTGFPNRLSFTEFRRRYELLTPGLVGGFIEGRNAAQMILSSLDLDRSMYQLGRTKVFFRAGLLADLEERRDRYMQELFTSFQSAVRGYIQRRLAKKRLYRHEAIGVIQQNLFAYIKLQTDPWWRLYSKMRPLLTASRAAEQERSKKAEIAAMEAKIAEEKKYAQKLEDERRRVEAEKARIEEQLHSERELVADTQEILRRSKQREQEMEDQLESLMTELEEADNNYDKLMDGFADSQRTVERMRAELNLGAQLVQSLQDEKLRLTGEIEKLSQEYIVKVQDEEQIRHVRELEESNITFRGEIKKLQNDLRDRRQQIVSLQREMEGMEKENGRIGEEKSKTQARSRALENELRIARAQLDELLSTNLDNENVIRMKDSQIALLQESLQQRAAVESSVNSKDYQAILDSNHVLMQQIDEFKLVAAQAGEARLKAEQAKKNALDQLYVLRQEAEIQREDLHSAEAETKKAWKIVAEANSKVSAQAKELKEAQDSKAEMAARIATLQSSLDQLSASTKFGSIEKSRLETEISILSRRLKTQQELAQRAEADLAAKCKELGRIKLHDTEASLVKITNLTEQKEKLEVTLRDWQARHADVASRLDVSETHRSRAVLEIEDLNHELARSQQIGNTAERLAMNLKSMLSEAQSSLKEVKLELVLAQEENSKLCQQLSSSNKDLEERTQQLLLFQRSIGVLPQTASSSDDWNALKAKTLQNVDLVKRLEEAAIALQVTEEAKAALERRLQNSSNWKDDFGQPSRPQWRTIDDVVRPKSREASPLRTLPSRLRERTGSFSSVNSATSRSESEGHGSDDFSQRRYAQNLRNEIEDLRTRLELSELQKRKLESLSQSHTRQNSTDVDALELRRLQRENGRLHELVDEQAEKLASMEGPQNRITREAQSSQQLLDNIKALEQSNEKLMEQQNLTLREFTKCRAELDKALEFKQTTDRQVDTLKQQLDAEQSARQAEQKTYQQSMVELKNLKIRIETMSGKYAELEDTIKMHRSRSEDLQNKLEDAEIALHNATRSESYARGQLQEIQDALALALDEQRKSDDTVSSLQKELRILEGKFEDNAAELKSAKNRCQRLEHDLQDLQTHQDYEVRERSLSLEQTRSKYQRELGDLTKELEDERNSAVNVHAENRRLRAELENIQAKIHDDRASGSSWAKEKSRMEVQYKLLSESFEEAIAANRETQSQQVSLLSQNRSLRASLEESENARAELVRAKLQLENRLQNLSESDILSHDFNPERHPGALEKKIVELKSELSEKQDAAAAAVEKMRRAEMITAEAQKEIATERQSIIQLHKDKALLEKSVNDLRMKLVDLETRSYEGGKVEGGFLAKRIQELEKELRDRERELSEKSRSDRNLEREIKSLEYEILQKEKARVRLEQDLQRNNERNAKLKQVIDEMMSENSTPTKLGRFASTRSG